MKTVYDLTNETDRITAGMHLLILRDAPGWEALQQVAAHLAHEDLRSRPATLEELAELRGRSEGMRKLLAFAENLAVEARDKSRVESAAEAIEAAVAIKLPGLTNRLD